jgi:radical SAM superfamily enzyme YgiQ (UPF0313 family)
MKIALVELPPTPNGKLFEEPAKDVYSFFYLPSRAIDLLNGIIRQEGFSDTYTINPRMNKGDSEIISEEQLRTIYSSDVVGISAITRTIPQSFELAGLIREHNPGAKIVFGGPHATALPDETLEYSDFVVRNEGDITFPELLHRLEDNFKEPALEELPGISYRNADGGIVHNPAREFSDSKLLTDLAFPVYSEETLDTTRYFTINTSRGCPYECEFCSVVSHFGNRYRTMSVDRTLEHIKYIIDLKKDRGNYSIFFGDDHFAANISRTKELLRRIKSDIPDMPRWSAQVRVETAKDPELLSLMKETGCFKVYIGFESIEVETLEAWNKRQDIEKITNAISAYHDADITIHGMFVFGSDYDRPETMNKTLKFANKMNIDTVQFISLLPLPGTPLYRRYEREGKILSKEWHKYSGHLVLIKPDRMSPWELQKNMNRALKRFYSLPQAFRQLFRTDFSYSNWRSNAALRFIGIATKFLGVREMREHLLNLKAIDGIAQNMDRAYERWIAYWREKMTALTLKAYEKRNLLLKEFTQFSKKASGMKEYYKEKYNRINNYFFDNSFSQIWETIRERFKRELENHGIAPQTADYE